MFVVFFWTSVKICPKKGPKTITFHILQNCWKHRLIKENVLLQPPSWPPNIGVFSTCAFSNQKHWCWTKKCKLKSGTAKIRKRDFKEKTRQDPPPPPKKEKGLIDKNFCNWIFWCCSFHETKAKKTEKQRKRQKQGTKRNRKRKTRKKK